jgi:hypothetical protein
MAIASGLPVPPVYVIPQPSINAFAAGLNFGDAVIGVNEGTLAHLDRDELQGVIAHEFSHLLNGDSRLNLRLLALLHGILFIGLVGEGLLRGLGRGARSRRSSGSSRGGSAGLPILLLGLGLTLIGYTGTLFGKLIRAAVSRQREYLADAAAVQFTRNPPGIAGALKKIGGLAAGSRMPGPAAGEASHLFFGPVTNAWFSTLTATHPRSRNGSARSSPVGMGVSRSSRRPGPRHRVAARKPTRRQGCQQVSLRPGLLPPAAARPDPRQPARRPRPRPWWRPSAAWTTARSTRPAGCWPGCRRSC